MADNPVTNEEWRKLYEAVIRVKELSPWEWMTETDVFGVQNPETGELGFVSVMGLLGEHYAVSLYLGPEGLYAFWDFEEVGHLVYPDALLELPQLQASFEDRNELDARDRKVIKELGLRFRGRKAWPKFRSYRPGLFPWFLEAGEVRFLAEALNQLLDVAPRFREDPSLLALDDESYLVRVARREDGIWEDRILDVPPPQPSTIPIEMDLETLERLKRLPRSNHEFEMDLFMFPAPVGKRGTRPFFPYMILTVEARSGMVLGTELLQPTPSLQAMWGSVPLKVAQQLAALEVVPKEIRVGSELLFELLQPLAGALRFKLEHSPFLPSLHLARESLLEHLT
jgi:hypothetical protein